MSIQSILRFTLVIMILVLPLTFPAKASSDTPPWSVLLITVDNLRPDRMSLYGYERDTTPFLKQFSREAVVFNNAYSTSTWTAPGMVSIFTGYYPPVHAQHGRFSFYDEEMTAAFRKLSENGYEILGQGIRGPSHQGFGFQKLLGKKPDRLASFIEDRIGNETPFFAWAHLTDVHLPYNPSQKNSVRFGGDKHTNKAIEAVRQHRVILRRPEQVEVKIKHAGKVEFTDDDIPVVRNLYDGEVADIDERLQGHINRMLETGLLDRTILIISADHGEELFDHGWLGHASTGYDAKLYDEMIHIPLIIRVPDRSLTGNYDAMVQGVDFMPTIFDILGINAADMQPQMQGQSFLPVIKGEKSSIRDYVFNQTTLKGWTTPKEEMRSRIVSVRSLDKKLIHIPTQTGTQIEGYDLNRDPDELVNIYPQRSAEFQPLEQALDQWKNDNLSTAASLVEGGAERRLRQIADAVLAPADLKAALDYWSAIQVMEETWGLEPQRFYEAEPYASRWQQLQQKAARMIGKAMFCRAQSGALQAETPEDPENAESWECG